jgi:predicted DNA-binding transcriptional regulator AlpA
MDKRKVIIAYRRGFITLQECSQILGIDLPQIISLMNDPELGGMARSAKKKSITS